MLLDDNSWRVVILFIKSTFWQNCKRKGVLFISKKLQETGYGFGYHVGTLAHKKWASAPRASTTYRNIPLQLIHSGSIKMVLVRKLEQGHILIFGQVIKKLEIFSSYAFMFLLQLAQQIRLSIQCEL